jgi:hypothetical protein
LKNQIQGGMMKDKLLIVGYLSEIPYVRSFNDAEDKFGKNFCYCSLSACDGLEWDQFSEIWATKTALKNSSKLRRLSKQKKVMQLNKDGKLSPYSTANPRSKNSKKQ